MRGESVYNFRVGFIAGMLCSGGRCSVSVVMWLGVNSVALLRWWLWCYWYGVCVGSGIVDRPGAFAGIHGNISSVCGGICDGTVVWLDSVNVWGNNICRSVVWNSS